MIYLFCGCCGFDAVVAEDLLFPVGSFCPHCRGLFGHERQLKSRPAVDADRPIGRDDRDGVVADLATVKTVGPALIDGRAVAVYRKKGAVYVTPLGEMDSSAV